MYFFLDQCVAFLVVLLRNADRSSHIIRHNFGRFASAYLIQGILIIVMSASDFIYVELCGHLPDSALHILYGMVISVFASSGILSRHVAKNIYE